MNTEGHKREDLFAFAPVEGAHVIEVGCGDSRFTWRYADKAAHVVSIDPDHEDVAKAQRIFDCFSYAAPLEELREYTKGIAIEAWQVKNVIEIIARNGDKSRLAL